MIITKTLSKLTAVISRPISPTKKMAPLDSQEGIEEVSVVPLSDPNYDYYSIDNILEEDMLLKVRPVSTILQAKCLRESNEDGTIPTDTDIEIPAWIAIPLIRNNLVTLVEPKEYNHTFLYLVLIVVNE